MREALDGADNRAEDSQRPMEPLCVGGTDCGFAKFACFAGSLTSADDRSLDGGRAIAEAVVYRGRQRRKADQGP